MLLTESNVEHFKCHHSDVIVRLRRGYAQVLDISKRRINTRHHKHSRDTHYCSQSDTASRKALCSHRRNGSERCHVGWVYPNVHFHSYQSNLVGIGQMNAGLGRNYLISIGVAGELVSRMQCLVKPWNLFFFIWTDYLLHIYPFVISIDRYISIKFPLRYYTFTTKYAIR